MHITYVSATFPPYRGGTGNVVFQNAKAMVQRGHTVSVITPLLSESASTEIMDGITVQRVAPLVRFGNAALLPAAGGLLDSTDLVHWHYPFFGGETLVVAARHRNIPVVVTYHQDVHLPGRTRMIATFLRYTVDQWVLRNAALVLFTSADYANASHAKSLLQGREAHIGTLPNAVDTQQFFPQVPPPSLRDRYGIPERAHVLLLVAKLDRAHYFKGVAVALEALQLLHQDMCLLIVGDGDMRHEYETIARQRQVADRVRFVGAVSNQDLPDLYRLADATLLPSVTMGEAFGLVLVESLACATPVIASQLPGVRTVVSEGEDGYLVPPQNPQALAQAIECLLANDSHRWVMGLRGCRKVAAYYSNTAGSDRLWSYYQSVLGSLCTLR